MSWEHTMLERAISAAAANNPAQASPPERPESVFVLRNNDIGDLLVVTPVFEALRRRFPETRIVAGIGPWNVPILEGNPHVDEIITLRAPWHNKYVQRQGWIAALRYILFDEEAQTLAARRIHIGLDILGSPQGSLLLLRARIPFRVGVRGYAGGHRAAQRYIDFDPAEHVGHAALRMAEQLGATELPAPKPRLFLTPAETKTAEACWRDCCGASPRLLLAPGAGLPRKQWSAEQWTELTQRLDDRWRAVVVGSLEDKLAAERLEAARPRTINLAGRLSLRQTLALVSRADKVVCHSSMIMHAAAAWDISTVVLLGPMFPSPEKHARQWGHPNSVLVTKLEEALAALNPDRAKSAA